MPTATETEGSAAPKTTTAKPKAAAKKPAEGAKKPAEAAKKPAEAAKKPAEAAKKPAPAAGDAKKPAAEKKPAAAGAGTEKKPAAEKKPADKKPADKKPVDKKQGAAESKPAADKRQPRKIEEVADEVPAAPVLLPKLPATLAVLNALEWAACAKVFGGLLDFTPSVGAAIAQLRPFRSAQHLVDLLHQTLDALPAQYIESFLKRFKELPLIPKGKLTKEHKCCVGLETLTEEQKSELTSLYAQYREKFGFPYVVCAREAKAGELAAKLRSRLPHEKAQELESGRGEVKKIARLRLQEVVVA